MGLGLGLGLGLGSCTARMVGVSPAGATTQPTRHPVALAVLLTALMTQVRSAIPGNVARLMCAGGAPSPPSPPPPPPPMGLPWKTMCS